MRRVRQAAIKGTLDSALTSGATSMESTGLEDLVQITGGDVAVLIIDPDGTAGDPECVYVSAHSASSNTATISRGEEQALGHGAARSHATGVRWEMNPTPMDFGFGAPEGLIEVPDGRTIWPESSSTLQQRVAMVTAVAGEEPAIELPNPADHVGEMVALITPPGAPAPGAWWLYDEPYAGIAGLQPLVQALLTAVGEGGSVDLTTATLGHDFVSKAVVDGGSTVTSDPLNDVYGPITSGDGYAEGLRLVADLVAPFESAGATFVVGSLSLTSPTTGVGSSIAFDPTQETIAGVDLVAGLATQDGKDGYVVGAVGGYYGAQYADDYYTTDDYVVLGGIWPADNDPYRRVQRSWILVAVPGVPAPDDAAHGYNVAFGVAPQHQWVPVGNGGVWDYHIGNSWAGSSPDSALGDLFQGIYQGTTGRHVVVGGFMDPSAGLDVQQVVAGGVIQVDEYDDDVTLDAAANCAVVVTVAAKTATLPAHTSTTQGQVFHVGNSSAADVTLAADGSDTINGAATLTIGPDKSVTVVRSVSEWRIL